jgi:hypothetical protein
MGTKGITKACNLCCNDVRAKRTQRYHQRIHKAADRQDLEIEIRLAAHPRHRSLEHSLWLVDMGASSLAESLQPHDLRATKSHGIEHPSTEPDHVLFCAGEPLLVQELARQIPDASVIGGRGLKLPCAGRDWRGTVKAVAEQLSAAARRDVRVAIIASKNEPNLTEHVMLAARSLEQFVSELDTSGCAMCWPAIP